AKAMAGQGDKNNEADVRLLFSRKEVFPLSFASSPHIGNKANKKSPAGQAGRGKTSGKVKGL
ncbi:MAG: hypothetical protein J6Q80_01515, partial [Lentisphaeria bacterium]|nr:hypothetical protein [Lentisphaeria bacterium]